MKKEFKKIVKKGAAAFIVAALTAGMVACGGSAEAKDETVAEESAAAQSTVVVQINPEQVNPEVQADIIDESADEAKTQEKEPEVIQKPEPSEEPVQEEKKEEPEQKQEEEKEAQEEQKESSSSADLSVLDEGIKFDGMELVFPVELTEMKLGNWEIIYKDVEDPEEMTLVPGQIVLAEMINPDYPQTDVTVTAEFGNYTDGDLLLNEIPMTGIYLKKGQAEEGAEIKLPEVSVAGGLTWGTAESEINEVLGEASFSSGSDEFDSMYENGNFLLELAGKKDTGVDYIVFCME